MTYAEYVDAKNDRRQALGWYGPIGFGGRAYRITLTPQERAEAAPLRLLPVAPRRPAAPTGRHGSSTSRSVEDQRARQRLERHRQDAAHDAVVRRLRALK